jgi:cysteine-rich repeat protein
VPASRARFACALEWVPTPVPTLNLAGVPEPRLSCREGDPRCDFDGIANNASCTFRTSLCINNNDPRTSQCFPSQIDSIEVRQPNPANPRNAADQHNAQVLEGQAGNGPGGFGVTVMRATGPVFLGRPNSTPNLCGPPLDLIVPMRILDSGVADGSRRLRLKFGVEGILSVATIRLTCDESLCGNRVVDEDETCDDGNRVNGDGCDQGCQAEVGASSAAENGDSGPQ